jgi:GNAT superfamily N-acetyltransferase
MSGRNLLRDAKPSDCEALSALAFASKASWGYDEAFMEACRAELTIEPEDLRNARVRIAYEAEMLGFHGVRGEELEWLFVAPAAMGRGVGSALLADACEIARTSGVETLRVEADPFAAEFYEHAGAHRIGEAPSASIEGRILPLYAIDLTSVA